MFAGDGLGEDGLRDVGGAEGAEADDEDEPRVGLERGREADEERHDGDHRRDEDDGPPPAALGGNLVSGVLRIHSINSIIIKADEAGASYPVK